MSTWASSPSMNDALAGFYSRVQRPWRPAWGRLDGPPERCPLLHVDTLVLRLSIIAASVGGDGTWMDERSRPASMGPLGLPPAHWVSILCPLLLLYSLIPLLIVPCERRKVGAGRPRARTKNFEFFCEVRLMQNFQILNMGWLKFKTWLCKL